MSCASKGCVPGVHGPLLKSNCEINVIDIEDLENLNSI